MCGSDVFFSLNQDKELLRKFWGREKKKKKGMIHALHVTLETTVVFIILF